MMEETPAYLPGWHTRLSRIARIKFCTNHGLECEFKERNASGVAYCILGETFTGECLLGKVFYSCEHLGGKTVPEVSDPSDPKMRDLIRYLKESSTGATREIIDGFETSREIDVMFRHECKYNPREV